jgi:hypothetical protein
MKKNDTSYFYVIFFIIEFQDIGLIYRLTVVKNDDRKIPNL